MAFLLLTLLAGCGKGNANRGCHQRPCDAGWATDRARIDPVHDGKAAKGTEAGGTIEKGNYQLSSKTGPTVGWNRVEIRAVRKTGKKVPKPFPAHGEMIDEQVEAIPPRFNSHSTLKVEVKPGDNTANFELESK